MPLFEIYAFNFYKVRTKLILKCTLYGQKTKNIEFL